MIRVHRISNSIDSKKEIRSRENEIENYRKENEKKEKEVKEQQEFEPQAPVRRRRKSKRRIPEQEECNEKNKNQVTIDQSNLPNVLSELLQESERQLKELKNDERARGKLKDDVLTSAYSDHEENGNGKLNNI